MIILQHCFLVLFLLTTCARAGMLQAPNHTATVANQLQVFANSCGPVSVYNAMKCGSEKWQNLVETLPPTSDKEKIRYIVRAWAASQPSAVIPKAKRWNPRHGINAEDLTDVANEISQGAFVPKLSFSTVFQKDKERNDQLLKRFHKRLHKSLKKGFPPVVNLQRYVARKSRKGVTSWLLVKSHFVTITGVPDRLEKKATSIPVSYIDPWGGRKLQGMLRAPANRYRLKPSSRTLFNPAAPPPAIRALFPETQVGLEGVRPGENSILILSGIISP